MIDLHIEGKVAIITGANHGIGAETAKRLAAQGAKVVVTYLRQNQATATKGTTTGTEYYGQQQARDGQEVVAAIVQAGGSAAAIELDLADPAAAATLFDFAERQMGPVEILVNNAAHCVGDTFDVHRGDELNPAGQTSRTFGAAEFDRHLAVNTRAVGQLMAEFAARHAARAATWGRVVNLSTDASDCFPTEVSYGASKCATESLSRSAAVELAKYGITVNVVSPGPIQTGYIGADQVDIVKGMIPLGRLGRPDDVADVIVFLASEQARWLTGQLLYVGGGKRM
jgi:3-oxoacyl-[acyl-carrier protein] reductase